MIILAQLKFLKSAVLYSDQFLNNSASPSRTHPSPITLPLVKSYSDFFFFSFNLLYFPMATLHPALNSRKKPSFYCRGGLPGIQNI